jgi:hypothetical protein
MYYDFFLNNSGKELNKFVGLLQTKNPFNSSIL